MDFINQALAAENIKFPSNASLDKKMQLLADSLKKTGTNKPKADSPKNNNTIKTHVKLNAKQLLESKMKLDKTMTDKDGKLMYVYKTEIATTPVKTIAKSAKTTVTTKKKAEITDNNALESKVKGAKKEKQKASDDAVAEETQIEAAQTFFNRLVEKKIDVECCQAFIKVLAPDMKEKDMPKQKNKVYKKLTCLTHFDQEVDFDESKCDDEVSDSQLEKAVDIFVERLKDKNVPLPLGQQFLAFFVDAKLIPKQKMKLYEMIGEQTHYETDSDDSSSDDSESDEDEDN
jgi:hypothetical protein